MTDLPQLGDRRIGPSWRRFRIGSFDDRAAFDRFWPTYLAGVATLPADRRVLVVDTHYGAVTSYSFGADRGVPVVLLPGRNVSSPLWAPLVAHLVDEGRRVITLDGPGEPGASVQSAAYVSPVGQAIWVDEALAGLGVDRAHLAGAALGGWLAVRTAIHRPDRVASLILLDPAQVFAPLRRAIRAVALGSVIPGVSTFGRTDRLITLSGFAPAPGSAADLLLRSGIAEFDTRFPAPSLPAAADVAALTIPLLALFAGAGALQDAGQAATSASAPGPGPAPSAARQVEVWADTRAATDRPDRVSGRIGTFLSGPTS